MHPSSQEKANGGAAVPHILAAFAIHPMFGTAQTGNHGQIRMLHGRFGGMLVLQLPMLPPKANNGYPLVFVRFCRLF